jgi:hypothetical protein
MIPISDGVFRIICFAVAGALLIRVSVIPSKPLSHNPAYRRIVFLIAAA